MCVNHVKQKLAMQDETHMGSACRSALFFDFFSKYYSSFLIFSVPCFSVFPFSLNVSPSSLSVLLFRIRAEAHTHGQMLTVSSRLVKTFSRPVTDWNELVGGANWPTQHSPVVASRRVCNAIPQAEWRLLRS